MTLIALAFNHAQYLPQLFASIQQNISSLRELLFIDNGSTDHSALMMRQFLDSLEGQVETRLFCNPPRTGVTQALNAALQAAASEFIAVISADDFFLPKRFTAQLGAMHREPEVQFCYSNGYACDDAGHLSTIPVHDTSTVALLNSETSTVIHRLFYPVPRLFTQCALFRRSALLGIGGWDEDLLIDDWPLNLKLFSRYSEAFRYVPDFVCAYRRHPTNASKRRFRQYNGQKQVLIKYGRGFDLERGLFSLFSAQWLASMKRRQWWRAKIFLSAAWSREPGARFVMQWLSDETRRHLRSRRIR
ncbi:MAG: glycosyltransferase family 2 protein [Rubrivivax sp.]|nr:glycosyltransferase family 2 protein [Rubrivivax sp.]